MIIIILIMIIRAKRGENLEIFQIIYCYYIFLIVHFGKKQLNIIYYLILRLKNNDNSNNNNLREAPRKFWEFSNNILLFVFFFLFFLLKQKQTIYYHLFFLVASFLETTNNNDNNNNHGSGAPGSKTKFPTISSLGSGAKKRSLNNSGDGLSTNRLLESALQVQHNRYTSKLRNHFAQNWEDILAGAGVPTPASDGWLTEWARFWSCETYAKIAKFHLNNFCPVRQVAKVG